MVEGYYNYIFECKAISLARTTCATPSLFTTSKALELADAALTNIVKIKNLLHPGQIFYGAATATINSVTIKLIFTQLLTPIHAESNKFMLVTVTAGKYLFYARC
jgi:hypothetical protein